MPHHSSAESVIIIGAGAAGCFAAIQLKRLRPDLEVTILERGPRPLAKVAITGGSRCNLTNSFAQVRSLEQVYPRGHRLMKRLMHHHSHHDTYQWFEREGVALVTQEDECVFPQSQDAMQIVRTLTSLCHHHGVSIHTSTTAQSITPIEGGYEVVTPRHTYQAQHVVVTIGGQPQGRGFQLLDHLNLTITPPCPSLFSFCIPDKSLQALMGIVVPEAQAQLVGTKLKALGPLLITHWGMSGPAILRLSSYAAPLLAERGYKGEVSINWMGTATFDDVREQLLDYIHTHPQKQIQSIHPTHINARLWLHLLQRAGIKADSRWLELQGRLLNRLINTLTTDVYTVSGKNRFKEEFVTCGGVSLDSISSKTLEAKHHPGLYFAGEALDVDAVTGGFNLQAAWTMGYVVAQSIAKG